MSPVMDRMRARGNARCRTCYDNSGTSNFYPLHEKFSDSLNSLGDLLLEIAKIDTKRENVAATLPQHLCGNCSRKLKSAYSFVVQAQKVNAQLLSSLSSVGGEGQIERNKLDSLLAEDLIDIPSLSNECVQVKMEVDYAESSFCDTLGVLNETTDNDATKPALDAEIKQKANDSSDVGLLKQEESISNQETPSSSNEGNFKFDPITIAETQWQSDDNDDSNVIEPTYESETESSDSEVEAAPKRRGRGRPRMSQAKKSSSPNAVGGRYICQVCKKTFAWKKDLQRHANSHFATADYECEFCERKFFRKDKLKDHMKIHLKRSGGYGLRPPRHPEWNFAERLYTDQHFCLIQCKLCGDNFKRTLELRQHMAQHEDPSTFNLQLDSEVVKEQYPQVQNLLEVKQSIGSEIAQQRLAKYYAVVNEYGYEMCLSDSDSDSPGAGAKYKCELCHDTFSRKYKVFAHIKQQHVSDQLPHKCAFCKVEFVCEQMYRLHTQTQCRSKEKKYQCLKCPGKFMWLENLEEHKCSNRLNTPEYKATLPHKRDLLQCDVCNKTFVWMKDLKRHQKKTHDDEGSCHECSICFQRFLKADNLRQHVRESHEQLKRRLECRLCEEKCEKLSQLRGHLQKHADGFTGINMAEGHFFKVYHPESSEGRETEVTGEIAADFLMKNLSRFYSAVDESGNELSLDDSESDEELLANDSPATYACEICTESFDRRKRLLQHQQSEHASLEALPHACPECKKQFVCLALLQHHLSRDCLNLHKKFQCEKCPARFVWADNLQAHLQLKHIDPEQQISRQLANKLQCDQCDKVFIWPKDLTRHRRVHMPDDEKYECPLCDRKFNRKDNMHSHMKVHGNTAAAEVCKKEQNKTKQAKVKAMDKNLCKPNGCKVIQCMICCSKHSKISDLRTHLRTHQYVVSFAQRRSQETIGDISALLYPDEPVMLQEALTERIIADVSGQQLERFYSITNEVGYELSINSSETESDSEAEVAAQQQADTRHNYSCDVCGESFRRKYKFFEHQKWRHSWEEADHVCAHCNARFLSAEFLQRHCEQQCNNTLKRFVCRKCPRRFMWKDNLKTHLRTIHAEVDETKSKPDPPSSFDCLQCKRSFKMQKDLTRHMVIHRDAPVLKCLWCPRKFYRQENLHMHIRRHGIQPGSLVAAECMISATTVPNGVKKIVCKVCNLQFNGIAPLRSHLLQETACATSPHHNFSSLFNYSITNKLGFELHIDDSETDEEAGEATNKAEGTPLKYTCVICSLTCRRKFEMSQHQRSVHKHEQIPLKCEKCIFKTVSQEILSHHSRTQCFNMEKQFQCHKCSFKFMWQENLQNHLLQMHTEEESHPSTSSQAPSGAAGAAAPSDPRMFQCDKCHRRYNRKDRLTAHIKKVHTDGGSGSEKPDDSQIDPITGEKCKKPVLEKKFLCAFCGRAVTSSSNLIIHMRRHTGEKPFKCDFCDMAFPRSSDLQCHRRTHTGEKPHKCTVCDKAFSRSYKLQTHMRIHSGERPYKCTYCEKSFTQSNDLTLHIRRHTGERPYVCGICGERFIQGTALKNHRTMRGHYEDLEPRRSLLEQF